MSFTKESKDRGQPSQSVYKSSDVGTDLPVPTQSVLAGSELVGDIATLSLQPCEACRRTEGAAAKDAKWFCRECDELLCEECKLFHKKIKSLVSHDVVNVPVLCSLCTTNNITCTGIYYCVECGDFLCTECKCWHEKFKTMKGHTLMKSQDKIRGKDRTSTKGCSSPDQQTKDDTKRSVAPSKKSAFSKKVSLADKKVQYVRNINVQSADDTNKPVIASSVFLSDSSLLLVDHENKKLKHLDSNFKLIQVKQFKDYPRCIALNENNEVVITTSGSSIIKLSVGDTIKEKGIINVDFDCFGIDFTEKDRFAVVGNNNPGIFCVYTMDGTELSRTTTAKMGVNLFRGPCYVTIDRDKHHAYASDYITKTVVALDLLHDTEVFRYSARNFNPAAIVLTDGCTTICNNCSPGSVYQISEEGVYNKLLLTEEECMKFPRTISFTPSGDGFIVAGGDIGSDAGKNIHLYRLR